MFSRFLLELSHKPRSCKGARDTHHVKVQAVDTNTGIVLNPQIDVLLDSKAKVSRVREVVFSQLVFSHLKQLLVTISLMNRAE